MRIALFLFLFGVGVTYTLAMARPIGTDEVSPADVALLALASWTGTMLLAHDSIARRDRLDDLIWRVAVCGALIAALGLLQIVTNQAWVDRLSIPGLTVTEPPVLHSRGGRIRPSGAAVHPIEYGVLLSMLLPLALHVAFHHRYRGRIKCWLPAALIGAIVPLTSSRSAYIGAVLAVLICFCGWSRARRLHMAAVGAAGLIATAVVSPGVIGSILSLFRGVSDDPSIDSRTGSISLAVEFIANEPLFGRGLGTFLPKYRIFDNQYLVLLVTIGIVGTLLFLLLAVVAVTTLLRTRAAAREESTRDLALALTAATVVGFVCLTMFDAFAFPMTMGTLFLLLGLVGALRRIEHGASSGAPTGSIERQTAGQPQ